MTDPARYYLDTNVLVRFFTGEPRDMFAASKSLIDRASHGEIILDLSPLILAETAFTLESFYQLPRRQAPGHWRTSSAALEFD